MDVPEIEAFLTFLAVDENVAPSTQNQAFSAILFLYRHVLKKELHGKIDAVRAKKEVRLPTVMSKDEVNRLIAHLPPEYQLIAQVLYGSGLRLMEGVRLRVFAFASARPRNDYQYTPGGNLIRKLNIAGMIQCAGTAHIHAATIAESGVYSYTYDANGNMTRRIENGVTYTQDWTLENRLAFVTWPGHSVSFTYDGDGNRLLKTEDGVTTVHIGNYFEKNPAPVQ